MRHSLVAHPDCPPSLPLTLTVEVERTGQSTLNLAYVVAGRMDAVSIPGPTEPSRRDGLWQHTCFEVFVKTFNELSYIEVNLSPSGEWAAYRFSNYRESMRDLAIDSPPVMTRIETGLLSVSATLRLGNNIARTANWDIAISAVIEARDGTKSYWALAHPEGKADFHHPDSFVLQLPGPA